MKRRNIALCILFSIISFGIYDLYWFVKLTNDSNTICPEKKTASGGMALLFSIITGGIYTIYWMYKLGQKLKGSGVLYLVLSLFGFGWLNFIFAQSEINSYIDKQAAQAAQQTVAE